MPELPEVESVRRGLADLVPGAVVSAVTVLHPRLLRDQPGGPGELAGRLIGRRLGEPARRGKFLWLPLHLAVSDPPGAPGRPADALVVHLGMSGQVRLADRGDPRHPHTRVVGDLEDGRQVRFVDQRMFGRLRVDHLVPGPLGRLVPEHIRHIAPDPLEDGFDDRGVVQRLRSRRTGLKRALLDQTLVSGIGNIYADEALWRSRLHGERPTHGLPVRTGLRLFRAVRAVLQEAVAAGGTSFDALYVDVNGQSGWFEGDLAVYGRAGARCRRCGARVVRAAFMNRSSFSCPSCQRRPPSGSPARPAGHPRTAAVSTREPLT